jgi:hypothetical protein
VKLVSKIQSFHNNRERRRLVQQMKDAIRVCVNGRVSDSEDFLYFDRGIIVDPKEVPVVNWLLLYFQFDDENFIGAIETLLNIVSDIQAGHWSLVFLQKLSTM